MADKIVRVKSTGAVKFVNVPVEGRRFVKLKPGQETDALLGVSTRDPEHPCYVVYAEECGYIERVKAKG